MGAPKRYSDGVTNIGKGKTLSEMPMLDPTKVYGYWNDFFTYADADWVITSTNAGTTIISATETGGVVVLTTDTAEQDADWHQLSTDGGTTVSLPFYFSVGKKAWFKSRLKLGEITEAEAVIGLHTTDTDPSLSAVSDGVWFETLDGVETLDLVIMKNSLPARVTGVYTLLDDTFVEIGWYWDGIDTIHYFINDVEVGSIGVGTSLPDDVYLSPSWGAEAGSGAACVMSIDYMGFWMER
jgi:hypothetical protein